MNFSNILQEGGIPGTLLAMYVAVFLDIFYSTLTNVRLGLYAIGTGLVVIFTVAVFTDHFAILFAWDLIEEADKKTNKNDDGERFYIQREEKKDVVDKHDNKVYKSAIAITSGLIVLITLPIGFSIEFGWPLILLSIPIAFFVMYVFIYKQISTMRKAIKMTGMEYE